MGAQVEVLVEIGGEKYTQSIHLLSTIARPHDNAAEGYIYYRFPEELRKVVQNSRIFARLQAEVMYCFRSKYALTEGFKDRVAVYIERIQFCREVPWTRSARTARASI